MCCVCGGGRDYVVRNDCFLGWRGEICDVYSNLEVLQNIPREVQWPTQEELDELLLTRSIDDFKITNVIYKNGYNFSNDYSNVRFGALQLQFMNGLSTPLLEAPGLVN